MRKIAFRAWDKNIPMMFEIGTLLPYLLEQTERYVVMQFTGLHDKNGKEIWEGDVIEVENEYWTIEGSNPWRGEVEFKDGMFYAGCQVPSDLKKSEVLGNIYEHPHLLTGKQ